jgi:hypothetical protein
MKRVFVLAVVSVLLTAVVAVDRAYSAERGQTRWGRESMPRVGVCFFENSNFQGQYFCVAQGDDVAQVPRDMNDKISSIRVIGNVEVTVFKDDRFNGRSARFMTDVRDLQRQGWNDEISSLRVSNASVEWERQSPVWGRQAVPDEGACFYRDIDFRGDYFCLPRGGSYAMVPDGFNDQISSIRVISSGGVMIFLDGDFGGDAARVDSDAPDLRRGSWNDRISSVRVY